MEKDQTWDKLGFNDAILNEELFPNFNYLLSHSMNFTNNYSPRNSCATADAEFSAITSLYALKDIVAGSTINLTAAL